MFKSIDDEVCSKLELPPRPTQIQFMLLVSQVVCAAGPDALCLHRCLTSTADQICCVPQCEGLTEVYHADSSRNFIRNRMRYQEVSSDLQEDKSKLRPE